LRPAPGNFGGDAQGNRGFVAGPIDQDDRPCFGMRALPTGVGKRKERLPDPLVEVR
jgi:hypothetical protein